MIRNLSITALIFLGILFGLVMHDHYSIPKRNLVIFYTSNLRGQIKPFSGSVNDRYYEKVGGFAFIKGFVNEAIAKYNFNPNSTLLLDTGDALFGSAEASLSMGDVPLSLMNKVGYDAMAIGNMEFEFGFGQLKHFINSKKVKMLAANYRDITAPVGNTFTPGLIIEKSGIKIGVIGLGHANLDKNTRQDNIVDIEISDTFNSVNKMTSILKSQGAEIIILISHHPELDNIIDINTKMPGVDLIIGDMIGPSGIPVKAPLICQTASNRGSSVGLIKIPYVAGRWDVTKAFQKLYPVDASSVKPDASLVNEINSIEAKVDAKLEEIIVKSSGDFSRSYSDEATIGNLIADSIREAGQADVAFQNSGGIKSQLAEGDVSLRDLYNVLPFENAIVTMELKGLQIENVVEQSLTGKGGFLQQSGLQCTYSSANPPGFRVIQIDVNDEPLEYDKTYKVAMNDFMANNDVTWPAFHNCNNKKVLGLVRENLEKYLRGKEIIGPTPEARFRDFDGSDDTLRDQAISYELVKLESPVVHDGTITSSYGRLLAQIIRLETHTDFSFLPVSMLNKNRTPLSSVTPARIISDFVAIEGVKVVELDGGTVKQIVSSVVSSSTIPLCFAGFSLEVAEDANFKILPWDTSFDSETLYKVAINEKFPLKIEGFYDISGKKFVRLINDVRRAFINGLRQHKQVELKRAFY